MNRKKIYICRLKQILITDDDHVYFWCKTRIQDSLGWAFKELHFVWHHFWFYCSAPEMATWLVFTLWIPIICVRRCHLCDYVCMYVCLLVFLEGCCWIVPPKQKCPMPSVLSSLFCCILAATLHSWELCWHLLHSLPTSDHISILYHTFTPSSTCMFQPSIVIPTPSCAELT